MGRVKILIAAIFVLGFSALFAQSTNLDVFYSLVEKSVDTILADRELNNKQFEVLFKSPATYEIFKGRLFYHLEKNCGVNLVQNNKSSKLEYSLVNLEVNYPASFRDGLFGDYYLVREFLLTGNYILETGTGNIESDVFEVNQKDTVLFDQINSLETSALPFTKSELPAEPFWESLVEPVVAIGSAVITIILFFTVRSN